MTDRNKIKQYLRREMKKIATRKVHKIHRDTFYFCWGQAKFDTLIDIDLLLNLGAFYKKK